MEKDILVILMVAFGLFAIVMFVLFFVYLKKYYNSKHLEDDYKKDLDRKELDDDDDDDIIDIPSVVQKPEEVKKEEKPVVSEEEIDMEFIPIKKK